MNAIKHRAAQSGAYMLGCSCPRCSSALARFAFGEFISRANASSRRALERALKRATEVLAIPTEARR